MEDSSEINQARPADPGIAVGGTGFIRAAPVRSVTGREMLTWQTSARAGHGPGPACTPRKGRALVTFDRRELNDIMRVYGRQVAQGEWRDYAIDQRESEAVFSIYRRTSDAPLYQIRKIPRRSRHQGMYLITGFGGAILRRGRKLSQLLRFFCKLRDMCAN